MQSIWEYLRFRTRDAMLAGMQDALDQAEADGTPQSQREAASRLLERGAENSPAAITSESQEAPRPAEHEPGLNGQAKPPALLNAPRDIASAPANGVHDPARPLDPFEARLQATNPEFAEPYDGPIPKKRGRPRKNP
jgi:hypothetical protein